MRSRSTLRRAIADSAACGTARPACERPFGIAQSDHLVFIRITVFNTRTAKQKKALIRRIAELPAESPGIRPEDVFVNILEAPRENWSVAQFA